jgi:hypothetical protein
MKTKRRRKGRRGGRGRRRRRRRIVARKLFKIQNSKGEKQAKTTTARV